MLTDSIAGTAAASWAAGADDDVAGMTAADLTGPAQLIFSSIQPRKRNTENRNRKWI